MKFRFCGDADCPDWLLMQINTLSSLSSENVEKLCQYIILSFFDDNDLNYGEVEDLVGATLLDRNEVKACLSAVRQIVYNAARHGVSQQVLTAELEQLGLQPTSSAFIGSVFHQHRDALTDKLRNESIRIARLKKIEVEKTKENELLIKMSLLGATSDKLENKSFSVTNHQLTSLLTDLKKLKSRMSELQNQNGN